MSTNSPPFFDIRIDAQQRAIIGSALLTFITESGFQGQASPADLEEARVLLHCIGTESENLVTGFINDLRPEG